MSKLVNRLMIIGLVFSFAFSTVAAPKHKATASAAAAHKHKATASKEKQQVIEALIPRLENHIVSTMKAQGIPGVAVAIVSRDQVHYIKGFGVRRLGKKEQITPATVFQIASLSKPVNATLLAVLQSQGKLSLDDPVHNHIANFSVKSKSTEPLKICHVLSHSTGMPCGGFNELIQAFAPKEAILAKFQRTRTIAAPGTHFLYHNAMYGILEEIAVSASGKSFDETIHQNLFRPLGMTTASVGMQGLLNAEDRAYPHVPGRRGYVPAENYSSSYYTVRTAGGINASAQDMVPFLQLYLGKPSTIIPYKQLTALTEPYVKNPKAVIICEAKKGRITQPNYGMGWHSMLLDNKKVIYHQGHLKGFRNFMGYLPDDVGIIILTNADKKHASKLALKFFDMYIKSA